MSSTSELLEAIRRDDRSRLAQLLADEPLLVRAADEHAKTGLHWAAELDRLEAARLLIAAGADAEALTSWGATPLDWAGVMGSTKVAHLLIGSGASGLTVIVAAGLGMLEQVRAIIESNADLSVHRRRGAPAQPDEQQWPADAAHIRGDVISDALYAAARNGHTAVVEYLLDRGASVDAKGFFGGTALHWAAIGGHQGTVDLLLRRGASVHVHDARFDTTPAAWAAEGGHQDLANTLQARARRN